MKEHHVSQ
jgi:hypothetical protein